MAEKITMPGGNMLAPVPAVMVTCGDINGIYNVFTVAWTGTVNSDPPMTYVSVRPQRYSHDIIAESGEFVINLTTEKLAKAADLCGVRSGRDCDKFRLAGLTPLPGEKVRCPIIAESPVSLECRVTETIRLGSHDMFLAEILCVRADSSLMDAKGALRLEKAGLAAYCHGDYYPLSQKKIGSFGFSVMKPKTKKRLDGERRAAMRAKNARKGNK